MSDAHACHICGLANAAPETFVHKDAFWSAVTMLDAPGVLMIFSNEHNGGLHDISPEAAAAFGPLTRTLSREMVAAGYAWVSLVQLGDTARHCHFMMVGRPTADTAILDAKFLIQRLAERKDATKAQAFAEQVRQRLASLDKA